MAAISTVNIPLQLGTAVQYYLNMVCTGCLTGHCDVLFTV